MKSIGFIGAGNMANAIIRGLIFNKVKNPEDLIAYDVDDSKLAEMKNIGIQCAKTVENLVASSEIIVLAVKPQVYRDVLSEISPFVCPNHIFVSIAAGISTDFVKKMLNQDCVVVRVMPNTPLLLGKGSTAICKPDKISDDDFKTVYDMFALSGVVEVLPEEFMNKIIAVNGSSPAYIYLFAKAMIDYSIEQGIDKTTALNLTCAALVGSAEMLSKSGDDPDTLIKKVSSPGGTTLKALESLEKDDFYNSIKRAMNCCTIRADEIGMQYI